MSMQAVENDVKTMPKLKFRGRIRPEAELQAIKKAYESDASMLSISLEFRMREEQLRGLAEKHGWKRPDRKTRCQANAPRMTPEAIAAMLETGCTRGEIAARYGVKTEAVSKLIRRDTELRAKYAKASPTKRVRVVMIPPPVTSPEPKEYINTVRWTNENGSQTTLPAVNFIAGVNRRA